MKKPFQVGDRVRIHDVDQTNGCYTTDTGTVLVSNEWITKVKCDTWSNEQPYYATKQCRRLIKKPRRTWNIVGRWNVGLALMGNQREKDIKWYGPELKDGEAITVVEVKKK